MTNVHGELERKTYSTGYIFWMLTALLKPRFSRFGFSCSCSQNTLSPSAKPAYTCQVRIFHPAHAALSLPGNTGRDQRAIAFGRRSDLFCLGGLPLSPCIPLHSLWLCLWFETPLLFLTTDFIFLLWPSGNLWDFNLPGHLLRSLPGVLSCPSVAQTWGYKWKVVGRKTCSGVYVVTKYTIRQSVREMVA